MVASVSLLLLLCSLPAAARSVGTDAPTVLKLQGAKDFVGSGGTPIPTGYSSFASVTTSAPFGAAIRSGAPSEPTIASVGALLSPGVTVESVAFSYRQCTGFATTGPGPNFTLAIAGSAAFMSGPLHGFPYKKSCPGGACYSPPATASASSLAIKVPSEGAQRITFEFLNTGMNLQLLLPMTLTLTCTGGPCTKPAPPPPTPNASAINISCVGDSITQGYLSTNGATYPNQLQKMLGSSYKVTNFGAGGRTMLKKGDNPYWRTGESLSPQPPFRSAAPLAPHQNTDLALILLQGRSSKRWRQSPA